MYGNKIVAFQGHKDVLSNMYLCKLVMYGKYFNSSEAIYQYEKAVFHNRYDIARKIISSKNGYEAKYIAKQIKVSTDWHKVKVRIMREVLRIKFNQCSAFKKCLHDNKGKHFIEATNDRFWGAGLKKCELKSTSYPGKNVLGKVLMRM